MTREVCSPLVEAAYSENLACRQGPDKKALLIARSRGEVAAIGRIIREFQRPVSGFHSIEDVLGRHYERAKKRLKKAHQS